VEVLYRMWCIPGMAALTLRLIDYEEKYVEVITCLPGVPAQHAWSMFELKQMLFSGVKEERREKRGKSQNHRMFGVGRDLCGSPSPTLLPKLGHPEQAAQDLVQVGLEYLQRRRLHSLPGQPGPGLRHSQREEVLPHVQLELPLLQFVPVAPCPVTGHH